jgi:hypothetical protein
MQNGKRTLPLLAYYLLTASITNLIFIAVMWIAAVIFSSIRLSMPGIVILLVFLLLKGLLVGYVSCSAHRQTRFDKFSGTRFVGMYFGRFYGLIIGFLIGVKIAEVIGAIIGAIAFYFAGRWAGAKVGLLIGRFLDSLIPVAEANPLVIRKPKPATKLFFLGYMILAPWLVVGCAFYMLNNVWFDYVLTDWLPTARIVVILLALFFFAAPWLIEKRMVRTQAEGKVIPFYQVSDFFYLGTGFSIAPTVYAFVLFIMGMPIVELCIYALASSLAAAIWGVKHCKAGQPEIGQN